MRGASARRDQVLVAAAAAAVYIVQGTAWPLAEGRDFATYLLYFNQFWDSPPAWPTAMLFRTPIFPLFLGGLQRLGGPILLEATLGVCFVLTICAVYAVGAAWSRAVAWISALLTAGLPTYGATFHFLSSDGLFACGLMVWMAYVCRTSASSSKRWFLGHGVAVFLLILTRPTAETLLLFGAFPFLLRGLDLRRRVLAAAVFAGTVGALLFLYATYNLVRYEDFTVARGGAAHVPFYKVLVVDRLVDPDNGPATQELIRAIERDLLDKEPYRSLGLDVATILAAGDARVWSDLAALSDRVWGWDTDHAMLRAVAIEAIRRHPRAYAFGVYQYVTETLTDRSVPPAVQRSPVDTGPPKPFTPRKGRVVPHSYRHWITSGPTPGSGAGILDVRDGGSVSKWRLPLEAFRLPLREGSETVAAMLQAVAARYPTMRVFLLVGVLGVALLSRHERRWIFLFLAGLGVVHVVVYCASTSLNVYYRTPFDPIFVVLGVAGFIRGGESVTEGAGPPR